MAGITNGNTTTLLALHRLRSGSGAQRGDPPAWCQEYSAAGKRDREARNREQQDPIEEADETGCRDRTSTCLLSRSRSRCGACWQKPRQKSLPHHQPKRRGSKKEPRCCASGSCLNQQSRSRPSRGLGRVGDPGSAHLPSSHPASRYFGGVASAGLTVLRFGPPLSARAPVSARVTPLVYPTPPRCLWAAAISPGSKPSLRQFGGRTNNRRD
jgi:hypothetical protein